MARKKVKSSKLFNLLLGVALVAGVVIIAKQEYNIYQIKKDQEAIQARIAVLKEKKIALEAEREKLDNLKHIEKLAREDYNMVGKNEVPIFIVEDKK